MTLENCARRLRRVAASGLLAAALSPLCVILAGVPGPVRAQTLSLSANATQVARVAADQRTGALVFSIDASTHTVLVDIVSTVPDLVTTVELPGGALVTETNAAGFGGSFLRTTSAGSTGPLVYPMTSVGTHAIYRLPTPATGNLVVRFSGPAALPEEAAVVVQLSSDSTLASRLFFTENRVVAGRPTVLAAAVFDGRNPVPGATVQAQLLSDSGLVVAITLRDDGGPADGLAGDGIYSGLFTPPAPGRYRALADITGVVAGLPFSRRSGAVIEVVRDTATLSGVVQARGIDLNANGALDQIALDAGANIAQPGTYRVFVQLGAAGGKKLVGSGDKLLAAGAQTATALINTQDLVAQGLGKGPYSVDQIDLMYLDNGNAIPADRKVNLGQIANFQFSAFERPALALTGLSSDRGVDTNGNGLFEQLRVQVQIDALAAGGVQFSGRLTDSYGTQLDLYAGSANLVAGLNLIEFAFSGSKIGGSGISGPYAVDSLLLFGGGRSLSSSAPVARTQAYAYTQFDGALRQAADLDNNGHVDCADVAIVKAAFGKRVGQVGFDARADLNHDGQVNIVDLSTVTRALPIGLRCP